MPCRSLLLALCMALTAGCTGPAPPQSEMSAGLANLPFKVHATRRGALSQGLGVWIGGSGHVLTASHVIEECRTVDVKPYGGSALTGRVVARDRANDMALVAVETNNFIAPRIRLRADHRPQDAEQLYYVDFDWTGDLGTRLVPTRFAGVGHLAQDSRVITIFNRIKETPARFRKGISGGPLFDTSSDLAGMVIGFTPDPAGTLDGDTGQTGHAITANLISLFLWRSKVETDFGGPAHPGARMLDAERAKTATVRVSCRKGLGAAG